MGVGDEGDIEWTMGISGVGELSSKNSKLGRDMEYSDNLTIPVPMGTINATT